MTSGRIPLPSASRSSPRANRPTVRTAKVYVLSGKVTEEELAAIKKYVINPVESREASLALPETLAH